MKTKTVQHTPGPWYVEERHNGLHANAPVYEICHRNNHAGIGIIANLRANGRNSTPEGYANACLIAAAPDLFDVAKELREAAAAAFRVIERYNLVGSLDREYKRAGIRDGFGTRAQEAIASAEPKGAA